MNFQQYKKAGLSKKFSLKWQVFHYHLFIILSQARRSVTPMTPEHIRQLGMPWVRQEQGPVLHFLVTEMQMKRISPVCNRIANQLHCFTHEAHKNVILPFDIRNEV